jgi:hypothetical protein
MAEMVALPRPYSGIYSTKGADVTFAASAVDQRKRGKRSTFFALGLWAKRH